MVRSFDGNQYQHYRTQLSAVQVDMNLIMRADLYSGMLEDDGEAVRRAVEETGVQEMLPEDEAVQKDYWALAGARYREFVREVNDCVEERDADLTALHVSRAC